MIIEEIRIPESRAQHIWQAHQVTEEEVYEAFEDDELHVERIPDDLPDRPGRLYAAFGRASNGRLLTVVFRYFADGTAYVITSRDMTANEKNRYQK